MASNRFLKAGGVYATRDFIDQSATTDLTLITQEVNKLKIRVTSNEENITNHTTKIDKMEPILNIVDETVDDHAVRIGVLEAKADSNQNRLTTIETNINNIETNIETNINNIETSINNNSNNISTIETNINTMNTTLNDYNSRIATLEGNFSDGDADATVFEQRLTAVEKTAKNNTNSITKTNKNLTATNNKILEINPHTATCTCENYLDGFEKSTSFNCMRFKQMFYTFYDIASAFTDKCGDNVDYCTALQNKILTIRDSIDDSYTFVGGEDCVQTSNAIHAANFVQVSSNKLLSIYQQFIKISDSNTMVSDMETANLYESYNQELAILNEYIMKIMSLPKIMPEDHDEKMNYLFQITKILADYLMVCCNKIKELLHKIDQTYEVGAVNQYAESYQTLLDSWTTTNNEVSEYTGCLYCYNDGEGIPTLYDLLKKIKYNTYDLHTNLAYQITQYGSNGEEYTVKYNTNKENVKIKEYLRNFTSDIIDTTDDLYTTLGYEWKYYDGNNVEKLYRFNMDHKNMKIKDYLKIFTQNIIATLADWFNSN